MHKDGFARCDGEVPASRDGQVVAYVIAILADHGIIRRRGDGYVAGRTGDKTVVPVGRIEPVSIDCTRPCKFGERGGFFSPNFKGRIAKNVAAIVTPALRTGLKFSGQSDPWRGFDF